MVTHLIRSSVVPLSGTGYYRGLGVIRHISQAPFFFLSTPSTLDLFSVTYTTLHHLHLLLRIFSFLH
ncbi:hypothetical protein VTN96DRAFT_486 [Rasamsonia emersonii]